MKFNDIEHFYGEHALRRSGGILRKHPLLPPSLPGKEVLKTNCSKMNSGVFFGQPANYNYFMCYIFNKQLLHLTCACGEGGGGGGSRRSHGYPPLSLCMKH